MRNYFSLFLICCFISIGFATPLKPTAGFIEKDVRIAEPIHFWISIKHPKNVQLVFPDSTYSFAPFEFVSKQAFQTQSNDSISIDSAVYTLTTFEITKKQFLQLPVYVLKENDSIPFYSKMDTIFFKSVLSQMPNPIVLKQDTNLQKVDYDFNYYYAVFILIIIIIIVGIFVFLNRKGLALRYHEYLLTQKHKKFLLNFEKFEQAKHVKDVQEGVFIWKKYLSELEKMPFDTYTSKELNSHYNHAILYKELQKIDYFLYANQIPDFSIEGLKTFATNIFETKKEELKAKYGR